MSPALLRCKMSPAEYPASIKMRKAVETIADELVFSDDVEERCCDGEWFMTRIAHKRCPISRCCAESLNEKRSKIANIADFEERSASRDENRNIC